MMQKVIVTIDTEGHKGKDPVDKLIWGNTKDGKYGIERIMEEFETVGVHILFFLDFAEAWDYGEEKIRQVADCILSRGHDIGVHIYGRQKQVISLGVYIRRTGTDYQEVHSTI